MMHYQTLVMAIRVNGKILREFKDTVYIPFGSEYSLLIKNLNTVRALVNITIDGQSVIPGGLVVDGNKEVDIERFVRNGNLNEGNKLKFIEFTSNIEKNRGVKAEDGIVRVEYQFENVAYQDIKSLRPINIEHHHYHSYPSILRQWPGMMVGSGPLPPPLWSTTFASTASNQQNQSVMMSSSMNYVNDVGITVPGSKSNQTFSTVNSFPLEAQRHVMILRLRGETSENKKVHEPITVKAKPKCQTCGKLNKSIAKYCQECGTSLNII